MSALRLKPGEVVVLLVDMQQKLVPVMHDAEHLVPTVRRLLRGARALNLPIVVTEQYPQGLGPTVPELAEVWAQDTPVVEKVRFSACVPEVRRRLEALDRPTVLLCGIEAHVCVLQTALDLSEAGHGVAVAQDAVGSRRPADRRAALDRMMMAGIAPVSVEMALLEMVGEAGSAAFKAILPLIK